jgi:hypothetical protein
MERTNRKLCLFLDRQDPPYSLLFPQASEFATRPAFRILEAHHFYLYLADWPKFGSVRDDYGSQLMDHGQPAR